MRSRLCPRGLAQDHYGERYRAAARSMSTWIGPRLWTHFEILENGSDVLKFIALIQEMVSACIEAARADLRGRVVGQHDHRYRRQSVLDRTQYLQAVAHFQLEVQHHHIGLGADDLRDSLGSGLTVSEHFYTRDVVQQIEQTFTNDRGILDQKHGDTCRAGGQRCDACFHGETVDAPHGEQYRRRSESSCRKRTTAGRKIPTPRCWCSQPRRSLER